MNGNVIAFAQEPMLPRYLRRGLTFEQWRIAWVHWDTRYAAGVDWRAQAQEWYYKRAERRAS